MLLLGAPGNRLFAAADALGRAVALLSLGSLAVQFHELGIVHVGTERALDRFQVGTMTVCGELDAIGKAGGEIGHEGVGVFSVTTADQPGHDQLGIGIQRRPRPSVASLFRGSLGGLDILLLGVGERPDLVALDPAGRHAAHLLVVEGGTRLAGVDQQLGDGVDRHVGSAGYGAHRRALAEHLEDLDALGGCELVHAPHYVNFYA